MLHLTLVIYVLCVEFVCLASARDHHNQRCEDVRRKVQCGFPGISRRKCLADCNCCFDSEAGDDVQCFYKVPPRHNGGCCDVKPKKRRACYVVGGEELELDENPYLCRRLGCCFDGRDHDESTPRCYETKQDCCKKISVTHRVDAALTHVNRRQCLRIPGTCYSPNQRPHCYYKYSSCRCERQSHHRHRPCSRNPEINKNPYKCLQAGCCYDHKNKCYRPKSRTRSADDGEDFESDEGLRSIDEEEFLDHSEDDEGFAADEPLSSDAEDEVIDELAQLQAAQEGDKPAPGDPTPLALAQVEQQRMALVAEGVLLLADNSSLPINATNG